LTLQRGGEAAAISLTLHRSLIIPPSVAVSQENGIATIAISGFKENTAAIAIEAIKKAKASAGFKGLILDLRGNPGGLLDQAVDLADHFIEQGRILTAHGRHPAAAQSQDARPGDGGEDIALVVLVDGGTASAAEILTADLQDLGRAVVVGTNSFGKGAIQTVLDLPNHGEMTLTWSRFLAPSGYALHGLGVLPNICDQPDEKGSGDSALAGGRAASRQLFSQWRGAGAEDRPLRLKLRHHCPAADHAGDKADLAIAQHLLEDRALFSHALAVARPLATAAVNRPNGSNNLR
jgi:carboxyl-terminal processing protease